MDGKKVNVDEGTHYRHKLQLTYSFERLIQ